MRATTLVLLALMAALPAASRTEARASESCNADLARTEAGLRRTNERLTATRNAPMAQRCALIREHIDVMQRATVTFRRCMSGFHARENIAMMQGSVADWHEIMARNCR